MNTKTEYPRIFSDNVEKLARMIHEEYNRKELIKAPDKNLEFPDWESLPETLKRSNIRQAHGYFSKLRLLDMYAAENGPPENEITELPENELERLAAEEHEQWCSERISDGWTFGETKNVEKKISPDLIPYHELTEEKKQYDRDAVSNLIPMLNSIGLKIYKRTD